MQCNIVSFVSLIDDNTGNKIVKSLNIFDGLDCVRS